MKNIAEDYKMKLFETTEGYINVLQNSNLSWELTLIRIEDELEQIKTKYKLEKNKRDYGNIQIYKH